MVRIKQQNDRTLILYNSICANTFCKNIELQFSPRKYFGIFHKNA